MIICNVTICDLGFPHDAWLSTWLPADFCESTLTVPTTYTYLRQDLLRPKNRVVWRGKFFFSQPQPTPAPAIWSRTSIIALWRVAAYVTSFHMPCSLFRVYSTMAMFKMGDRFSHACCCTCDVSMPSSLFKGYSRQNWFFFSWSHPFSIQCVPFWLFSVTRCSHFLPQVFVISKYSILLWLRYAFYVLDSWLEPPSVYPCTHAPKLTTLVTSLRASRVTQEVQAV